MSELQRITNKLFVWGQKLKAQELNDIISVINNIIDYININESYWLKDEVGNGDSNLIVPTYYDLNALIIARINKKNGEIEYLYAPSQINGDSSGGSSEGGDTISISSILYNEQNGILLAILNVNGRPYKICAPKLNNITADDIISINPKYNLENGIEIAEIFNKNGLKINSIYTPKNLNNVSITPVQFTGETQTVANFNINGLPGEIKIPKALTGIQNIDIINDVDGERTQIADINIDGNPNRIYIPSTTITSLTPTLLDGVEIAKYRTAGDSQEKILLAPAPSSGGGTTSGVIELLAIYPNTGEPIAQFKLAGATSYTKIYAPKNTGGSSSGEGSSCSCTLSVNNLFDETTGVQVATIIFNGDEYPIYAPKGSGGGEDEPVTYELYILYEEEYGFNKYLVFYKHQGNVTSQEKRVSHTSGIAPERKKDPDIGTDIIVDGHYVYEDNDRTMSDALTKNDPTTGDSIWDFGRRIEFEEFFLERTSDGDFTFTIGGEPKFIRCGSEIQHHTEDGDNHTYDWKLKPGTLPGQGYGSFEYIKNHNYYVAGRDGWNNGLDINPDDSEFGVNSEGRPNNPPTEFEVYANIKLGNGNKGIYKIGEYDSVITPELSADVYEGAGSNLFIRRGIKSFLKATIYDAVEGGNVIATYPQSLEEVKPNHMPREIVELPNHDGTPGNSYYYVSYADVAVALDNFIMQGYAMFTASELSTLKWKDENDVEHTGATWESLAKFDNEKNFVEMDFSPFFGKNFDFNKWRREYLSYVEYYPSNDDRHRQRLKGFERGPVYGDLTLTEGDVFIYFKKKVGLVSTRIHPIAKVYINGIYINPWDYGWDSENWQYNACMDYIMNFAQNDLIEVSTGNTYLDSDKMDWYDRNGQHKGNIPTGYIPAWISYYDTNHPLPDDTLIGTLKVKDLSRKTVYAPSMPNAHYHGKWEKLFNSEVGNVPTHIYTIPFEEYVYRPDGNKCERFGGNDYEIVAFRANGKNGNKIEFKDMLLD